MPDLDKVIEEATEYLGEKLLDTETYTKEESIEMLLSVVSWAEDWADSIKEEL